ncbi:MAG TPA: hypothetical protein VFX61_21715 [Micromonosporaceae bacterium]|nr:hypothetical protein [Micromonosporaceae bacterium]
MSEQPSGPDEPQIDVVTVTRDELLLSALGRGDPPPAGDTVGVLLAAWRAELNTDLPTDDPLPSGAPGEANPVPLRSAAPSAENPPAAVAPVAPVAQGRRLGTGRRTRFLVAAAVAGLAFTAGLATAAANAGPESPLWPITQLVYEERADSLLAQRDAEEALDRARTAAAEGRYTEAVRLLDEAAVLIDRILDPSVAHQLRGELAALRGLLPGAAPLPAATTAPSVPVAPPSGATPDGGAGSGSPSGAASATPAAGVTGSAGPTSSPGGLLPGLPLPGLTSLLPSLPLPDLPGLHVPEPGD